MVDPLIQQEIQEQLDRIPLEAQYRVLDFAKVLAQSGLKGEAGKDLLPFAGFLDPASLREMIEAIESACEQVDIHEW